MNRDAIYVCGNCGYCKGNKGWWCNCGCGRDYNRMTEIKYGDQVICYGGSDKLQFEATFEGIDDYGVIIVAEQLSIPVYRSVGGKFIKPKATTQ